MEVTYPASTHSLSADVIPPHRELAEVNLGEGSAENEIAAESPSGEGSPAKKMPTRPEYVTLKGK